MVPAYWVQRTCRATSPSLRTVGGDTRRGRNGSKDQTKLGAWLDLAYASKGAYG